MHFLTLLIIFSGFVFVLCLGLVQVIWDLSRMSGHAAPQTLTTRDGTAHVSSSAADLGETL